MSCRPLRCPRVAKTGLSLAKASSGGVAARAFVGVKGEVPVLQRARFINRLEIDLQRHDLIRNLPRLDGLDRILVRAEGKLILCSRG